MPNDAQQHIMVVEDDESLARWIVDYLSSHGYLVTLATRGDTALELIRQDQPDALILDLNLPGLGGLEVCRQARRDFSNPIIMLTARDADADEISGLDAGADDYLAKPVRARVLLARLRALLRRAQHDHDAEQLRIGGLTIDITSRTVTLFDRNVDLSTLEFDVLKLLAMHAGECLNREKLISEVRGIDYDGFDRSVDICVSRLRRKLGSDGEGARRIKTIRGSGYMLTLDAWQARQ